MSQAVVQPDVRTLYLVDGTSQLYRAYYAIRGLSNPDGMPTNAIYGFTSMLRKLLHEESPSHLAVVFDASARVFRHSRYEEYKANRAPTPADLGAQLPYAKEVCRVLGVAVLELEGFEADDLIATYGRLARRAGFEVVIVASDKDLLQLVGDGVTVLNPSKNIRLDAEEVARTFGVPPERVSDVLGLMGDSVDNLPGVPGVGEKTALSVVSTYGDLESVIQRAECFVSTYEARDELLQALDGLAAQRAIEEENARRAAEAGFGFSQRLARLIEIEKDKLALERLVSLQRLLRKADLDRLARLAGRPGREAAQSLQELRRELKAMERGSSRRIWCAIKEHAGQARLSKELASLQLEVPVEFRPDQLGLAAPSRRKAFDLFQSLGFRALSEEFAPADAARSWVDARTEARGRYEAVLTVERLREIVLQCRRPGRMVLKTEMDGADPLRARLVGLSLSHTPTEAFYIPLGHDYAGAPQQLAAPVVREVLEPILSDPGVAKVAHDLKSQSHVLGRYGLKVSGWNLDTMVAAFLLSSSRSTYSLDSLAEEYLSYAKLKYEDLFGAAQRQLSVNQVEIEQVTAYAAEACDITLRLASLLEDRLREAGLLELYTTIDGPLLPLLTRMEARGIRIEAQLLQRMSLEMEGALARARQEIFELAGVEFNVDSPKQLREVLFTRMGLRSRRRTIKSGEASTDAQTLEELAGTHPIAQRLLEYREMAKLKGTYVDSLPRMVNPATGRVHTTYHPTGAATGRLSSSDPNLQNVPVRSELGRRIREAFVPEQGHLFLACDYSQIELRVLAHLAGDAELAGAFRVGEDIHRHTAARIFNVDPELVTSTMRRRAKAVNFGVLYGMSETRLAREQGISRVEAHRFIEAYFERFGAVRSYIEGVRDRVRREGLVRTLFGRVRLFPQLLQRTNRAVQEQALRAAVNATIQGTAADLMKLAMVRVESGLERTGCEAHLLLQVHDELLLEVPERWLEPVAATVKQAMEQVYPLEVPLVVDQKAGRSWLEVT